MDKTMFQNLTPIERLRMLRDNCDQVDDIGYMKPFTPEQILEMKDDLSSVAIGINDVEEEKKRVTNEFKEQLKPLSEKKKELLGFIKKKAKFVNEECYKFIDHEDRMVAYYNAEGAMVESRPIRSDELQLVIKMNTGTHD